MEILTRAQGEVQDVLAIQREMLQLAVGFARNGKETTPVRLKAIEVSAKVAGAMLTTVQTQEAMRLSLVSEARDALRVLPAGLGRPADPFEAVDRIRAERVLKLETRTLAEQEEVDDTPDW